MVRLKQRQGEKSIHHFSHKHELFFYYYLDFRHFGSCVVCHSRISTNEEYLSCGRSCGFHMHKSCAELPQKLKHPFHPQHSLTLLEETPWRKGDCYCCACGKLCTDFVYECSECEFYIDTKCAMLFPTTRLPAKHQKLRHPHPLFVCERKIVEPHILDFQCGGCFASFDDDTDVEGEIDYSTLICVCLECHVLLHESCADLPQNITHHPLHPNCTLAFHTSTYNYSDRIICDFCQYKCRRLYFQCSDCSIKMDICCALLTPCTTSSLEPPVVEEDDIGHGHPHPLIHCNIHVHHYGWRKCSGCEQPLEKSVYYCISCKLWLHESCAHLPHQIQHPFHPHHRLTLSDSTDDFRGKEFTCNSRYKSKRFAYLCHPCSFYLDLRYSSPPLYPMIYMPKLHKHPLAFSDIRCSKSCRICDTYKDDPFYDEPPTFRCMQCEFDIHISCFPLLPPTVKALCHRHPLTLTRHPIGDPDGSVNYNYIEVYYCDICENERSLISILNDPSYYCAECHLVSHVHCVISEVMNYLKEKSTSVEELLGGTKLLVFDETISDADMKDEDFDNLLSGVVKEIETVNTKLKEHREECAELSSKLKQEEEICAEVSRKLQDLKGKHRQLIKERRDHIFHLQIERWSKDR